MLLIIDLLFLFYDFELNILFSSKLQDPKNKQFAICDDELLKVFGKV